MNTLQPVQVLFVCMGNICRSPMAEAVFRHLVNEAGLADRFLIDSAGTGGWHAGEPPHGGTLDILRKYRIDPGDQRARQLRAADFDQFDYILAMDHENMRDIAIRHPDVAQRVRLLLDYAPEQPVREVPDPYYDGGFEQVYRLITSASRNLLREIRETKGV
ncbi:MAG: low molecular weight phosphotyrosine protein phosphatase [Oscillochloris sp.]|nr:low molecular weight phosphotyrosine protein phosphatase [Oscillochloris sp.]